MSAPLRIVADENIPFVREAFAPLGDITTLPGRAIDVPAVADADVLLVRSVTRVDAALLDGANVRFVGTATIGEDHVDKAYLESRRIGFASAPGSNANSVAEYIVAALLELAAERDFTPPDRTLGIIGHGNVGTRVEHMARALGIECVLHDPPRERATGDPKYRPMDELLERCNILTYHVPLTHEGDDATYHMADAALLDRVRTGTILINTSRGAVVDSEALQRALEDGRLGACVLDVWEGEPDISLSLMANCAIATPHIAGYSMDGKVNGTRQIYDAARAFFGDGAVWDPAPYVPPPYYPEITVKGASVDHFGEVRSAVKAMYDIRRDDAALRRMVQTPPADRAAYFDQLRANYPIRREFGAARVNVNPPNAALSKILGGLGFQMA